MAETPASTAYGPMVMVALEQFQPPEKRLTDDPRADQMLPLGMRLMIKAMAINPLRRWFLNTFEKSMPGLRNGFVLRKRYINETIKDALNDDFETVVILGAGIDTLSQRLPEQKSVRVYEVDLPENIAFKRKKLNSILGTIPDYLTLIPVDFEHQKLDEALEAQGYSFDQKTVFIWEAVTQYLTEDAVRDVFAVLAKARAGSRLLFTYVRKDFIDGENRYGLETLYQQFRVKNPIWHFGLAPDELDGFLQDYGWKVIEDIGAEAYVTRYLTPAGRNEQLADVERMTYAEKS